MILVVAVLLKIIFSFIIFVIVFACFCKPQNVEVRIESIYPPKSKCNFGLFYLREGGGGFKLSYFKPKMFQYDLRFCKLRSYSLAVHIISMTESCSLVITMTERFWFERLIYTSIWKRYCWLLSVTCSKIVIPKSFNRMISIERQRH